MKNIDIFLNELSYISAELDKKEIKDLEKKYNCIIKCDIEKINQLQYFYFYEIDFNKEEKLFIEIENGINNGTQVNDVNWGVSTKNEKKNLFRL